jgi:hypothetical protein
MSPSPVAQYRIVVPYRGATTIKGLLSAGNYDEVSSEITDHAFPVKKVGDEQIIVTLMQWPGPVKHRFWLGPALDNPKLHNATAAELLALGAVQPDIQRNLPIIALGDGVWGRPSNTPVTLYLFGDHGSRGAGVIPIDASTAEVVSGWCRAFVAHDR